jgi:hypothetical protein
MDAGAHCVPCAAAQSIQLLVSRVNRVGSHGACLSLRLISDRDDAGVRPRHSLAGGLSRVHQARMPSIAPNSFHSAAIDLLFPCLML